MNNFLVILIKFFYCIKITNTYVMENRIKGMVINNYMTNHPCTSKTNSLDRYNNRLKGSDYPSKVRTVVGKSRTSAYMMSCDISVTYRLHYMSFVLTA